MKRRRIPYTTRMRRQHYVGAVLYWMKMPDGSRKPVRFVSFLKGLHKRDHERMGHCAIEGCTNPEGS